MARVAGLGQLRPVALRGLIACVVRAKVLRQCARHELVICILVRDGNAIHSAPEILREEVAIDTVIRASITTKLTPNVVPDRIRRAIDLERKIANGNEGGQRGGRGAEPNGGKERVKNVHYCKRERSP